MNKLQIILIGISLVVVLIAVLILLGVIPGVIKERGAASNITMWGFDEEEVMEMQLRDFSKINDNITVDYQKIDIANFENQLINALASGSGPDVLVYPSDYLLKHRDKLSQAPPILITEREIKQNFIEAASFFLTDDLKILGLPFYADALVLYWNRDLFTQNFITLPPKTWEELAEFAPKLTQKDEFGNVTISGIALGKAKNIKNAHLILTALFLQSGEKIMDSKGNIILGTAIGSGEATLRPAESSLRFFSEFSNPRKNLQSWSGALPEAKELFIGGKLAMYIGGIQDYAEIKSKNPHLNFSVAKIPQLQESARPVTYGTLFALAVPKMSRYQKPAWELAKFLSSNDASISYTDKTENVSLWRRTLPLYQKEAIRSVFSESVLMLTLWPNPDPEKTEEIFKTMIEDAASGRIILREAIGQAKSRLGELQEK